MESHPQNPEFRNNPENFHPWYHLFMFLGSFCTLQTIWTQGSSLIRDHTVCIHDQKFEYLQT